jgi:hypothetical protein
MKVSRRLATYEWYANCTVWLSAILAVILGASILIGGPRRFSSPGLAVARMAPGGYITWGCVLLTLGLVMAVGISLEWRAALIMCGFIGMAAWYGFFALTQAISAARDPSVAFTGVCTYSALATLCVLGWTCGEGLRTG